MFLMDLSLGFLIRSYQNQPTQRQRLARIYSEILLVVSFDKILSNKRITKVLIRLHQPLHLHRLVCAFVVNKPPKTGFLMPRT